MDLSSILDCDEEEHGSENATDEYASCYGETGKSEIADSATGEDTTGDNRGQQSEKRKEGRSTMMNFWV
ncbi:hypothetical protein PIB30_043337 [Stylosanthes scabra]|uniref:Uncharacterized protein n=1 Tax=Stylosanthes scabra TaxID=79078 RepID=A0ABU6UIS3_9FABA|nr:hypothetical protein [Stylosanthes scabra]